MISKSLPAWLLVLLHLDLTAAMRIIGLWNEDAARTPYQLLTNEPNQLAEPSNTKYSQVPKFFKRLGSSLRNKSTSTSAQNMAIAEDSDNLKHYYNHIFIRDPQHPRGSCTPQWLRGHEFDERLDSTFRHKYISGDHLLRNLLEKFRLNETEAPQKLSYDTRRLIHQALHTLLQMQPNKDPETAVRIAHYFQVFCQISGVRRQERTKLNHLILACLKKHIEPLVTSRRLNRHGRYLYRWMERILPTNPSSGKPLLKE
ncbi:hypothetical protein PTTG_12317 [Puccinia triticina 1-1 BBBD Race 1]|uniref:Uncharacterized protein n=1 Tax=Puccinia triticina (isolate 1-1 / race 1 (BBBD)) TaxID=630390 RepID=A0A180GFG8_PUCT1|nr:hypothetical protein PTTG_12317 [Puccinia triticina 1-1 BBBD Race 1]WAR53784.1 hypothetical protein PtB15_3B293 [Puccinia triticina]